MCKQTQTYDKHQYSVLQRDITDHCLSSLYNNNDISNSNVKWRHVGWGSSLPDTERTVGNERNYLWYCHILFILFPTFDDILMFGTTHYITISIINDRHHYFSHRYLQLSLWKLIFKSTHVVSNRHCSYIIKIMNLWLKSPIWLTVCHLIYAPTRIMTQWNPTKQSRNL